MEMKAPEQYILPDLEQQEPLVRENEADDLVGEQTWPTDKVPFMLPAPDSIETSCTKAGSRQLASVWNSLLPSCAWCVEVAALT